MLHTCFCRIHILALLGPYKLVFRKDFLILNLWTLYMQIQNPLILHWNYHQSGHFPKRISLLISDYTHSAYTSALEELTSFISRWIISFSWRFWTAKRIFLIIFLAWRSSKRMTLFKWSNNSHFINSKTRKYKIREVY